MTDRDQQLREIQRNERWLHDRLNGASGDLAAPDAEAIKGRVRLALQERWLADELSDDVPQDLAKRLKATTVAALGGRSQLHPTAGMRQGERGRRRIMAGWGLAAAACLMVYMGVRQVNQHDRGGSVAAAPGDPFSDYQEDDLLVSLTQLSDDFDDLDYSLSDQVGFDTSDFMLDDLLFQMDGVLGDGDGSS
ncbi:MAG: hypothetical protein ACE5E5_08015 [Phycisphaerae bacterium]